jgi:hypothetical protein
MWRLALPAAGSAARCFRIWARWSACGATIAWGGQARIDALFAGNARNMGQNEAGETQRRLIWVNFDFEDSVGKVAVVNAVPQTALAFQIHHFSFLYSHCQC